MENEKQFDIIIAEKIFQEPIENKSEKRQNPKSINQTAREHFRKNDKRLPKKMPNPYYFIERALQIGFNITLDTHNINHANSKIIIEPNFPVFRTEFQYINEVL